MSQLITLGGQSVEASASVLPMTIQDWFPSGLTGLISLLSKGLWSVISYTTVEKHQFFGAQLSLYSKFYIHTWLLEMSKWKYFSIRTQFSLTTFHIHTDTSLTHFPALCPHLMERVFSTKSPSVKSVCGFTLSCSYAWRCLHNSVDVGNKNKTQSRREVRGWPHTRRPGAGSAPANLSVSARSWGWGHGALRCYGTGVSLSRLRRLLKLSICCLKSSRIH